MQQAKPPAASASTQPGGIGPRGVASFLKTQPSQEEEEPKEQPVQVPHPHRNLARLSLWSADLLLLGVAAYMAFGTGEPLSPARILLCIVALLMGAWLSILALRL